MGTDTEKWFKKEGEKVLKPGGLLSVYPKHMELEEVKKEIKNENFYLKDKFFKTLIHESRYIKGYVLNFRKIKSLYPKKCVNGGVGKVIEI